MAEVKLTKNELRAQETRLGQLRKYLPTLQLKKAMLQAEVNDARQEIEELNGEFKKALGGVQSYSALFLNDPGLQIKDCAQVDRVNKRYENIAGVEVPYLESIDFSEFSYGLFETPEWFDAAVGGLRRMKEKQVYVSIAEEKKAALEKELRDVSIRVNLFEKILIPRAEGNIKKIKVFLGDQQLAAVSQAKVAKEKIVSKKKEKALLNQGA